MHTIQKALNVEHAKNIHIFSCFSFWFRWTAACNKLKIGRKIFYRLESPEFTDAKDYSSLMKIECFPKSNIVVVWTRNLKPVVLFTLWINHTFRFTSNNTSHEPSRPHQISLYNFFIRVRPTTLRQHRLNKQ